MASGKHTRNLLKGVYVVSSHLHRVFRRRSGLIWCGTAFLALLFLLGFSSSALAQQEGTRTGPVASLASEASSLSAGSPFVSQSALLFGQENLLVGELAFCRYCGMDYCGCIPLSYCTLIYSCSCSSIECKRSCSNVDCKL